MNERTPAPQRDSRFHFDDLTGPEVDEIFQGLVKRPLETAFAVFNKLQQQLRSQLAQQAGSKEQTGADGNSAAKKADKCQRSEQRPSSSGATH